MMKNFLQIFEILRLAIVHNSLEKEKRQNSAWLRQLLPTPSDITKVIQQAIGSRSIQLISSFPHVLLILLSNHPTAIKIAI